MFKKIKSLIYRVVITTCINFYWIMFKLFLFKPSVLSEQDTINKIIEQKLSISRYGDGEFRLMIKKGDIGFQKYDESLSNELTKCFAERDHRLLICCYDFKKNRHYGTKSYLWLKRFVFYKYKYIKKLFDKKYVYGNAEITRFYHPDFYKWTNFEKIQSEYIPLLKQIWSSRNIIIVEGENTKLGLGNDLFESCASIRRVICPSKNAFSSINKIELALQGMYRNNDLILLALGPTASVLAVSLTISYGWQCIDIGHIDVVYTWFLNKSKSVAKISGKDVNEAHEGVGEIKVQICDNAYLSQIVKKIE